MKKKLLAALLCFATFASQANFAAAETSGPFSDVDRKEITYLYEKKIVSGYEDGTFRPKNPITRAESLVMIEKALGIPPSASKVVFTDVPQGYWAAGYIQAAYEHNITTGYGDGTFKPDYNITRAEVAALLSRAFQLTKTSIVKYLDVPKSHPYYLHINKITTAGIASGTSASTFSPARFITREEFAVMLARTVNPSTFRTQYIVPKIVQVDAGHGGSDPGAVAYGKQEKDIVLDVSKRIELKLEAKGIQVLMSRTNDTFVPLDTRAAMSADYQVDAFVSIHANAGTSSATGIETFYKEGDYPSQTLGTLIQNNLIASTGSLNRGTKPGDFRVLRTNSKPAVLTELGFMTNYQELNKLMDSAYRDKLATAISNGVDSYIK